MCILIKHVPTNELLYTTGSNLIMLLMFLSKGRTKKAFDSPLRKPPTLEPDFIISNYSESSDNCSFDDGTDDDTHDERL